jgi:hypothetical protein
MLELLEEKMSQLKLSDTHKTLLREALKAKKFSKVAQQVANQLRMKG